MTTTQNRQGRAIAALRGLGFSEIEALVYAHLLAHAPTTGYRVSHAIGKPVANTYKAIAELARRGAVQIDDGDNRLVRATPVEELLAQMDRQARERRGAAAVALADLASSGTDDRVYSLHAVPQVLERARAMIERASHSLLADLTPRPFAELRDALEVAAARGVAVSAKIYEPPPPPAARKRRRAPVDLVPAVDPSRVRETWPGEQLTLVADAREHLLALLAVDLDAVHQAVWSTSTYLSCLHHNHVAIEIEYARLGAPPAPHFLLRARPPGLLDLQARYGRGSTTSTPTPPKPRSPKGGPR